MAGIGDTPSDAPAQDETPKRRSWWRRVFIPIARAATISYVGAGALLLGCQSCFVYFPHEKIEETPDEWGLAYEDVTLTTEDGVGLHGWYVSADEPAGVVLFCHGNAGNVSHRIPSLVQFGRMGVDTFIFDYRGYGRSDGKPSEKGTYRDAEAAWRYLTAQRKIPPERIVIFGRSLGGAIAARLGRDHPCAAVVIESTFTCAPDMAARMLPIFPSRWMCRFDYNTELYVKEIASPVLVVHSRSDEMIPFAFGRRIFAAAKEPKEFLEIAGPHNDGFLTAGDDYEVPLQRFIREHLLDGVRSAEGDGRS